MLNQDIAEEEKDEGVSRGRSRNFKGGARGGGGLVAIWGILLLTQDNCIRNIFSQRGGGGGGGDRDHLQVCITYSPPSLESPLCDKF